MDAPAPTLAPTTPRPTVTKLPDGHWDDIEITGGINLATGLGLVVLAMLFGRRAGVFDARRIYRPWRVPDGLSGEFLEGLKGATRLPDEQLRRAAGTDAWTLLRFLRLWRDATGVAGVVALCVLLPVYASGKETDLPGPFYETTIAHLKKGLTRMWAPVAFMYFFTWHLLRGLDKEARRYARARTQFLGAGEDDDGPQARCSVLVERVPPSLRDDQALADYFRRLMGAEAVHSAVVFVDCRGLEKTLADRDAARAALEAGGGAVRRWRWDADASEGRPSLGLWRVLPARDYWGARLARLERALADGQRLCSSRGLEDRGPDPGQRGPAADEDSTRNPLLNQLEDTAERAARRTQKAVARSTRQIFRTLALEDVALSRAFDRSSSGIVTFSSPGVAATASQIQLAGFRGIKAARGVAPERADLIYGNAGGESAGIDARGWLADLGLLCLGLGWSLVVAFVQSLANLEDTAATACQLAEGRDVDDGPDAGHDCWLYRAVHELKEDDGWFFGVLTGFLPVLLLLVLLILVPVLLEWVATNYVRFKTRSAVQQYVLDRHFYYQLATIFISVVSGSLFGALQDFLEKPATLAALLGTQIPKVGAYFLQLLGTKALTSTTVELARPWPLVLDLRPGVLLARRPADAADVERAPEFKYGHVVPQLLMVSMVAALYAAIAPLVLVPAFVFFLLAEQVYRRNFLLVYVRRYESGGRSVFPNLVFFSVLSLVAAQLTLISYIYIGALETTGDGEHDGVHQASALIPLPLAAYYRYRRLVLEYIQPSEFLHRDAARDNDLFADLSSRLDADYYRQPSLMAACAPPSEPSTPRTRVSFNLGVDAADDSAAA